MELSIEPELVLTPADDKARKLLSTAGTALIALAFIGPFAAVAFGSYTYFSAGEDVARTAGALLFLAFISWLTTRTRSPLTKAKARFVVGLLLCLTVGTNIARAASAAEDAKRYVREALEFRDQQMAKFTGLGQRFDKVDLSTVLTPQSVATPAGLANSRATLAQYKALLAERDLLLQSYLTAYERFVNERAPDGEARRGAFEIYKTQSAETSALYQGLGQTQRALASAMEMVLDWGEAQAGRIGIQNGQLLFSTREQQQELASLVAQVGEAEKTVNATVAKATETQQRAQAQIADQNQRAAEFLKK